MTSHLSRAQRLTRLALLTALALIIFIVEAQIPPLTAIPGVKLGLANIITLMTLYEFGPKDALMVLLVRIFLGSVFSGQMLMLLFSLAGGLLCYAVCALLYRHVPLKRLWLLSAPPATTSVRFWQRSSSSARWTCSGICRCLCSADWSAAASPAWLPARCWRDCRAPEHTAFADAGKGFFRANSQGS